MNHNPALAHGPCPCRLCVRGVPLIVRRGDDEAAEAVRRAASARAADARVAYAADQLRRAADTIRAARLSITA